MIGIWRYRSTSEHQRFIISAFHWSLTMAFEAKKQPIEFQH